MEYAVLHHLKNAPINTMWGKLSLYLENRTKHINARCGKSADYLSLFILVINQLDAQNFVLQEVYFIPLHVSSTVCSSSGVQNCIIQPLVSSHSVGGRPVHRCTGWPPTEYDDTRRYII